jgi:hypothetical protein
MAVINPPIAITNAGTTHTAEALRSAVSMFQAGARAASSLVPRGGVHAHLGGQLAVTQNGSPNMSVNVANGVVAIPGTEGTTQGEYICVASTVTNLSITAAHATLPRIDIIVASVQDQQYSGASNQWLLQVVTGTAAGSPTAPAAPVNSVILANIAVAAAVTSILTANITDVRPYSAYGVVLCRNTTDYPNPALEGMVVYNMADDGIATYDGTTWKSAKGSQFLQRVIVTTSGTFVKASFPGLKKVLVKVQAGGGGGGGAQAAAAGNHSNGAGGGGGGYAESWLDASSLAASVTLTAGGGGSGGVGAAGSTGSTSSFGTTVVATGGGGGTTSNAATSTFGVVGGTGGIGTAGDILQGGTAGGFAYGTAALGTGGVGGASNMGGGAPSVTALAANQGSNGVNGSIYGGGGGGAYTNGNITATNGGAGAAGIIVMDLYV